jgi:hypothetical protein
MALKYFLINYVRTPYYLTHHNIFSPFFTKLYDIKLFLTKPGMLKIKMTVKIVTCSLCYIQSSLHVINMNIRTIY